MRRRRWYGVVALTLGLALTAGCGGSDEGSSSEDTANASGKITVWAMGAEGEKLARPRQGLQEGEPGVKVNVTPIAMGAGARQDPDLDRRQQDARHQSDGSARPGWASSRRPARSTRRPTSIDQDPFFESAARRRASTARPTACRGTSRPALLYYRTDIAEKAGITAPPKTWDELKTMAQGDAGEGRRQVRHHRSPPTTGRSAAPFVWQNGGEHRPTATSTRSTRPRPSRRLDVLQVVLRREADRRPAPRGLRHHAGVRARHAPDVLLRARGTWA